MPVEGAGEERFTTRAYRHGDEQAILELFAQSFPHAPRSHAHFHWKYLSSPLGNERISLTFEAGGKLVGHYAGYPVPFHAPGRDFLAHQIGDTMTDPSIRHIGRGPSSILGRTALHFYSHFCDGKVAFNYGFNVANIQKFSLRFLRSDRVEPVTYRWAPPPRPIGRTERRLRGYSFEVVSETGPEWDALFSRVAGQYRFLVRRDAAWVRWRYLHAPEGGYVVVAVRKWRHLVGWLVYKVRENRFVWGDALFDPDFEDAPEVALRHLVPALGVEAMEAWFPPRPRWFDRILAALRFETRTEPQNLSVMCVPFTWPDVVERMREDLYYSWGDSDLF